MSAPVCAETRSCNQRAATGWVAGFRYGPPTGSLLGYARVSTVEQTVRLQTDALATAGCFRVFTDMESGAKSDRPQLMLLLDQLRRGTVW